MSKAVTSEDIRDRFIELLNEGKMNYSDELQIFEAIAQKYDIKTISDYARDNKLSYNGVLDGIKHNRIPSVTIGKVTFCFM